MTRSIRTVYLDVVYGALASNRLAVDLLRFQAVRIEHRLGEVLDVLFEVRLRG